MSSFYGSRIHNIYSSSFATMSFGYLAHVVFSTSALVALADPQSSTDATPPAASEMKNEKFENAGAVFAESWASVADKPRLEDVHRSCVQGRFSIICNPSAILFNSNSFLTSSIDNSRIDHGANSSSGADGLDFSSLDSRGVLNVFQVYRSEPTRFMEHNAHFLPRNSVFRFYNDHDAMDASVKEIDRVLAAEGVAHGFYEAFSMLRPVAFQTDLWRAAVLWLSGGLYMDHKILLAEPLDSFLDTSSSSQAHFMLPLDSTHVDLAGHFNKGFQTSTRIGVQNAFMYSSTPRHPYWEFVLRRQIHNVQTKFYGSHPCEVTGPIMYFLALDDFQKSPKSNGFAAPERDLFWKKTGKTPANVQASTGNYAHISGGTIHGVEHDAFWRSKKTGKIVAYSDGATHRAGKAISMPYREAWSHGLVYCASGHANCGPPMMSLTPLDRLKISNCILRKNVYCFFYSLSKFNNLFITHCVCTHPYHFVMIRFRAKFGAAVSRRLLHLGD